MNDKSRYAEQNRKAWDEIADVRGRRWEEKHPLDQLLEGGILSREVLAAAGEVQGKSILHLQCATGEESISWAGLGARVTAIDISERQIDLAKARAKEAGVEVEFIAADVYQMPGQLLRETFDTCYTGGGVLGWLPDLEAWAQAIARTLRSGGLFVLEDEHPLVQTLSFKGDSVVMTDDYFQRGRAEAGPPGWTHFDDHGVGTEEKYEFIWPLGDVITALANAGLRIERVEEFPARREDQLWRFRDAMEKARSIPGRFLLVARK